MMDEYTFSNGYLLVGLVLALIMAAVFGTYNIFKPTDDELSKIKLLSNYQNGFNQCNSLCLEENKTGYIHAYNELNHKCFCYSTTNGMETQSG